MPVTRTWFDDELIAADRSWCPSLRSLFDVDAESTGYPGAIGRVCAQTIGDVAY